jgi:beta-1,4-N-acetylglucosaminyltransferase
MSTFVTVGNATQPFPRLLRAIVEHAERLPQPVTIQYGNNDFSCNTCQAVAFMNMEQFAQTLTAATVVVMHAGVGSIIHALRVGKVPVVVPRLAKYRELIDDHQLEIAQSLEGDGKVILVLDVEKLESAVQEALARQADLERRPAVQPRLIGLIAERLSDFRGSSS